MTSVEEPALATRRASGSEHEGADVAPPLVLRGLTKTWPRAAAPVVADVALTLEAGSLTSVVGRNGAGKTTLLRLAAGLILPEAGTVRANGADPVADRRRYQRGVGFLTTGSTGLYARLTVRQHLDFQARIALLPRGRREDAVRRELGRFALGELADRRVDRISMGQRQRVRLAMTLVHGPRTVLLDEPRNSLDDEGLELLHDAVRRMVDAGAAVLWCAPRGEDVGLPGARALALDGGRLTAA